MKLVYRFIVVLLRQSGHQTLDYDFSLPPGIVRFTISRSSQAFVILLCFTRCYPVRANVKVLVHDSSFVLLSNENANATGKSTLRIYVPYVYRHLSIYILYLYRGCKSNLFLYHSNISRPFIFYVRIAFRSKLPSSSVSFARINK